MCTVTKYVGQRVALHQRGDVMLKQQTKKRLWIYFLFTLVAVAAFSVIRTWMCLNRLNLTQELFYPNDMLTKGMHWGIGVVTALLCTVGFVQKNAFETLFMLDDADSLVDSVNNGFFSIFANAVSGCLLCGAGILTVPRLSETVQAHLTNQFGSVQHVFTILLCISAIPAALYFFCKAAMRRPSKNLLTLFGLGVVLWHISLIISTYFDISVAINSPIKILDQFSFMFTMVYFLNECREHIGTPRPRFHLAIAFPALFLSAVSAIPNLITQLYNPEHQLSVPIIYCAVQLAFCLHIIADLIGRLHSVSNDVPQIVAGAE